MDDVSQLTRLSHGSVETEKTETQNGLFAVSAEPPWKAELGLDMGIQQADQVVGMT